MALLLAVPIPLSAHGNPSGFSGLVGAVPRAPGSYGGGPCTSPRVPGSYSASLAVEGSDGAAPTIRNVSVSVSYYYTWNYTPSGGSPILSCVASTVSNRTNAAGHTGLSAPIPTSQCAGKTCSFYSGPYGPVTFGDPAGDPAGYFLTSARNGGEVTLDFVLALASLDTAPFGRAVVSESAPTPVRAVALAGNGVPSPANLSYAWRLSGTGWSLDSGSSPSNRTVTAMPSAGPAVLEVWSNGTFNGTSVGLGPATLDLTSVPTSISSRSALPTSVDVGESTHFTVDGTGAAGYSYTAQFLPGLGAPPTNESCSAETLVGGLVGLSCAATIVYAQAGLAQPSVNLTNGYSTANVGFPTVTVAPALAVRVSPSPVQTYVGDPTRLVVSAADGSGTPPYGPACLSTGDGRTYCGNGTDGPWTFDVRWGTTGTFGALASVVDEAGVNGTDGFGVQVVERPTLAEIVASSGTVDVGQNVTLTSYVTGGAYPLEYWWNDSIPGGTVYAGAVDRPTALDLRYDPPIAGNHTVTLTVVDALGTETSQPIEIVARLGRPAAVGLAGPPPNATTTAGSPWVVALDLLDSLGEPVPGTPTGETVEVALSGATGSIGTTWVNDSSGSTEVSYQTGSATFDLVLPPLAWSSGGFSFSVTTTWLGGVSVGVSGPLVLAPALGGRLSCHVGADPAHLRLFGGRTVDAGDRMNATMYQVTDRFGNAAVGLPIVVNETFGSTSVLRYPRTFGNLTWSGVWVNFSAPTRGAGVVLVTDPDGNATLLAPIRVPAAPPAPIDPAWVAAGVGAALLLAVLGVVIGRGIRRRRRLAATSAFAGSEEEELRRLAEGRAHVLSVARTDRPVPVEELGRGFPGGPPAPAELAEWVGALVAEGALRAVVGPGGRPGFIRTATTAAAPPPRVDLDPSVLDEALALRALEDEASERER